MWNPRYAGNMAETTYHGVPGVDAKVDVPFQPWAKKIFDERQESQAKDDPEARCMPAGLPRYMFTPYPFEMIQTGNRVIFLMRAARTSGGSFRLEKIYRIPPIRIRHGWAIRSAIGKAIRW